MATRTNKAGFVAPAAAAASFRVSTGLSLRSGERAWAADAPGELSIRQRLKFTTERHVDDGMAAVDAYLARSDDPLLQGLPSFDQSAFRGKGGRAGGRGAGSVGGMVGEKVVGGKGGGDVEREAMDVSDDPLLQGLPTPTFNPGAS